MCKKLSENYEKALEKWEKMTITSDPMFGMVMQNKEICLELINRALPHLKATQIVQLTTQKDINKAKRTQAYKNELMATVDENIAQHRDDRTYYHSLLTHAMVDAQNNRTPTEKNSNPYSIGLF